MTSSNCSPVFRKGKARVLTDTELEKVVSAASTDLHAERNIALLYLSFGQGLRVKELSTLSIGDVMDSEGNLREIVTLTRWMTKEGRPRFVYLENPIVRHSLQTYIKVRHQDHRHAVTPGSPLFLSNQGSRFSPNSLQQVFHRLYANVGIQGASSHSGRRTFATRLIARHDADIYDVAVLLGHRTIGTTIGYVDDGKERLRNASRNVI